MRSNLILILISSLPLAAPALGGTIKVPGDQPTIAAAEAVASNGDTIKIAKDRYQEAVTTTKSLTFKGEKGTIWDGYFSGAHNDQLIATADNVKVDGIEFQNGGLPVFITGNHGTVKNCTFNGCDKGVQIDGSDALVDSNKFLGEQGSSMTIIINGPDCTVKKNDILYCYYAGINIDAQSGGSATVTDNLIDTSQDNGYIGVANANAPMIKKNVIQNCYVNDAAIDVDTCDDAVVTGNKLLNLNYYVYYGIYVTGERAMVTKNVLDNLNCYSGDHFGVYVSGDDCVIQKNDIFSCGAGEGYSTWGVYVSGNNADVQANEIKSLAGGGDETYGIEISGNDGLVTKNEIDRLNDEYTYPIYYTGDRATISKNEIRRWLYDYGIYVSGDDFMILDNQLSHSAYGAYGIYANGSALTPGSAVISKNRLERMAYDALYLGGDGVTLENNTIKHIADDGFYISGNNNILNKNTAKDCMDDCFYISGNGNTLTKCTAKNGSRDGFDISSGSGNSLVNCQATNCAAEGLDNGGTTTSATNCKFKSSRIDYAGNSNMSSDAGTTFTTGGAGTVPEID